MNFDIITSGGSRRALLCSLSILLSASAFAQFDQNVEVEGRYKPEIIPQERIGLFPTPVKFPLETSQLQYSMRGVAANFRPQAVPIPATGWQTTRTLRDNRGYVDFGIGSWLTSTLSAGYRIIDEPQTLFGVRLQHNSTSLWNPEDWLTPQRGESLTPERKLKRYDENIGVYGSHSFDGAGTLQGALDYHLGYFNYYGFQPQPWVGTPMGQTEVPSQSLNDVALRLAWDSPAKTTGLQYRASFGLRYFGYRRLYLPTELISGHVSPFYESLTGSHETDVNIAAGLVYTTSSRSTIGLDFNADFLSYSDLQSRSAGSDYSIDAPDSYGLVSLTPHYRFTRDNLKVQVGAKIDLAFNAGPEGDRFSAFHIAPAVMLDYNAGGATLYAHILGGVSPFTLASNYNLDYYQMPGLFDTTPLYSPVDAKVGVNIGPFSGFEAGIDIAYRSTRGQRTGGLYQTLLNYDIQPAGNLPLHSGEGNGSYIYNYYPGSGYDIHGYSAGINLGYDAGRYFKFAAEARYQPQNGKRGYFNGYDRARWTLDASAETNPWSTLRFKLAYQYRGVRNVVAHADLYPTSEAGGDSGQPRSMLMQLRLPDWTGLSLGASYDFSDSFGIWLQGDNLLNRHDSVLPCLPAQGLTLTAGISYLF